MAAAKGMVVSRAMAIIMAAVTVTVTVAATVTAIFLSASVPARAASTESTVRLGVDVLLSEQFSLIAGKRVGLITNPTGIDSTGRHIIDRLHADSRVKLVALFSPEHGIRGDAQAGAKVDDSVDGKTGLPIYSLYGKTVKPTPQMLKGIDVLLFDIQDIGARFYTYIYTMAYAMEAAAENKIPFVVLDRPNPIGGTQVEGPVLDTAFRSFVGRYPIPIRHGMTAGELARMFNEEFGIEAKLTVVPVQGWHRSDWFDETRLIWVKPSPNMVTLDTATVYPGLCLIEGTNVSEGRGTPKPFETIGAPWIDGPRLASALNALRLPGVKFEATRFAPTASKYQGEPSEGVHVRVTDRESFQPVRTGLYILATLLKLYPNEFQWRMSGNRPFVDLLAGTDAVRVGLDQGIPVDEIVKGWSAQLQAFQRLRAKYLLY